MKFLHVSDLHIGKRVNGMSMIDDQVHILRQIAGIVRERAVDALVIAGDIYDKASPSAEAVTVFDAFLTELASQGTRVIAVPGNHDSAERIAYAQGLLERQGVCFPPVFAGEVERVELVDEHGDVVFWLLPFLKPGDVRRFCPEREIGDDYAAAIRAVVDGCEVDPAVRNVIVSHQLVTASGGSPERADEEIKLGGIDNVDVSVYAPFDYVALGHVHRQQRIGRDTARYSGSPLKYSASEARYDKKAVLVELGAKGQGSAVGDCASIELVPLVPLHDMHEVRMTLAELLALGEAARSRPVPGADVEDIGDASDADDVGDDGAVGDEDDASGADELGGADNAGNIDDADDAGDASGELSAESPNAAVRAALGIDRYDYLHVTLTDEYPPSDAMSRVRDVFPNAMTLDYDNVAVLKARQSVKEAVDPAKVDMADLFARFYEEQAGKPLDDEQVRIVASAVAKVAHAGARGEGAKGGAR